MDQGKTTSDPKRIADMVQGNASIYGPKVEFSCIIKKNRKTQIIMNIRVN